MLSLLPKLKTNKYFICTFKKPIWETIFYRQGVATIVTALTKVWWLHASVYTCKS